MWRLLTDTFLGNLGGQARFWQTKTKQDAKGTQLSGVIAGVLLSRAEMGGPRVQRLV